MLPDDYYFMTCALKEAKAALSRGDVPVGALIVKDNAFLASASDRKSIDPTQHAEVAAIREAAQNLHHWNLAGCTLYVTLEPCPMCAGACVNSRISRVVFGAKNYKSGSGGTLYNILRDSRLNHVCNVSAGVLENECLEILQNYFLRRRERTSLCSQRV